MNQNDIEKLNEIKKDPNYDQWFFDFLEKMCKDEPNDQELGKEIRYMFTNLSDEAAFH